MRTWLQKPTTAVRAAAFSAVIVGGLGLQAPHADAACLFPPAKFSDTILKIFKDRPGELLVRYPGGNPQMSSEVKRLAGSDEATIGVLVQLARQATQAQIVAVGIGLAQAATICQRTSPGVEEAIRQAVTQAGITELSTAFATGLSVVETARVERAGPARSGGAPIGNLRLSGGGGFEEGKSFVGGPSPLTAFAEGFGRFGDGGVRATFGNTVSPTR